MKRTEISYAYISIFLLIITTISCKLTSKEGTIMTVSTNSTIANDNIEELTQFINLPFQPESVLWTITSMGNADTRTVPGPTDYRLEAVLKYSREDMEKIRAQANAHVLGWDVEWEESYFESWYPDSVKQSFTLDMNTGKYKLNSPVYDASEMFGKAPYLMGSFIITSGDEVFLNLSTG